MTHLAQDTPLPDVHDRMGPPGVCGQPFLFAIARDARTIFASWNINWRSVFEKAMPADRQVHLRVIGGRGRHRNKSRRRTDERDALRNDIRIAQLLPCGNRLFSAIRHLAFCRDVR